jgi:hypothetical protein
MTSPRYSGRSESDRILHFAQELSSRFGGAVKDMIPPEAQYHLMNAQREMLTALFLIYEHQAGGRRPSVRAPRRPAAKGRKSAPKGERLSKIDIE